MLCVSASDARYKALSAQEPGNAAWAVAEPISYGSVKLMYTQINGDRLTDYLVIYNGAAGSTTKTNMYGYEILVSAEGLASPHRPRATRPSPRAASSSRAHGVNAHGAAKRLSAAG